MHMCAGADPQTPGLEDCYTGREPVCWDDSRRGDHRHPVARSKPRRPQQLVSRGPAGGRDRLASAQTGLAQAAYDLARRDWLRASGDEGGMEFGRYVIVVALEPTPRYAVRGGELMQLFE